MRIGIYHTHENISIFMFELKAQGAYHVSLLWLTLNYNSSHQYKMAEILDLCLSLTLPTFKLVNTSGGEAGSNVKISSVGCAAVCYLGPLSTWCCRSFLICPDSPFITFCSVILLDLGGMVTLKQNNPLILEAKFLQNCSRHRI